MLKILQYSEIERNWAKKITDLFQRNNWISQYTLGGRPTERGGQPGRRPGAHEFKQVESCFLNYNSSIHFCCTDYLLMIHRGGLSLSINIWSLGPKNSLGGPVWRYLVKSPHCKIAPVNITSTFGDAHANNWHMLLTSCSLIFK